MKVVLSLLIAFPFVFVFSTRPPHVNFMEADLRVMKKLSLPARAVMMRTYEARVSGSHSQKRERKVGISAQVAGPLPFASKVDIIKSSFKPKTRRRGGQDQAVDDLATMTKMFQLMLETSSDSAMKSNECEEYITNYLPRKEFRIGENMSKCDSTVNVLKEAGTVIKLLSANMTQLEHVDAYERIIILSEQLKRDCDRASEIYKIYERRA